MSISEGRYAKQVRQIIKLADLSAFECLMTDGEILHQSVDGYAQCFRYPIQMGWLPFNDWGSYFTGTVHILQL